MVFQWLRQMRRRLTGSSHGLKRAKCLKRRIPGRSESLEPRQLMSASGVPAEISEATLAGKPDLGAVAKGAPVLAVETTLVGQLQTAKDQDIVGFQVQANQKYRIELSVSGIARGKVEAKSADGKTTLATGEIGADGRVALELDARNTETISLKVFSMNNSATGGYRLVGRLVQDDVADTAAKSLALTPNTTFSGHIDHTRDQDWFRLSVQKGEVYRLQFQSLDLAGARLTVFDATGKTTLKKLDAANGQATEIEWTSDRTGSVTFQVLSSTKALGRYSLTAVRLNDEYGNAAGTATVLPAGKTTSGSLQFAADSDWFKIEATAGHRYELTWNSSSTEKAEIAILKGAKLTSVSKDSLTNSKTELLSFTATESGTYFVKINRPSLPANSSAFRAVVPVVEYELTLADFRPNSPPKVANPLSALNVDEDSDDIKINVSKTFSDSDKDDSLTLSISNNSNSELVTAELVDDELCLSFTPNANGSATITLRAEDSAGAFVETKLTVNVRSVNDAPEVIQTLDDVRVDEDAPNESVDLTEVFGDVDVDDKLTYSVVDNENPELVTASIKNGQLWLKFAPNQNGKTVITLRATDRAGASAETELSVTADPVNDAPIVSYPLNLIAANEDSNDFVQDLSGVFLDVDEDKLEISIADNSNPDLVTAEVVDGQLVLTFAANQHGPATLTLVAMDGDEATVETTVEVFVNPINDAPIVAQPLDDLKVLEDADDIDIDLTDVFSDVDLDDVLTLSLIGNSQPQLVTAQLVDGHLLLSFAPDQHGEAMLTLRATDSFGDSVEATLLIDVGSVNDDPTVANPLDDVLANEDDGDVFVNVDGIFADKDNDDLEVSVIENSNEDVVAAEIVNGQLRLSFAPNQHGTFTLKLLATDGEGATVETTLDVIVSPQEDNPDLPTPLDDVIVEEDADDTFVDLKELFTDADAEDELVFSVEDNSNSDLVTAEINEEGVLQLTFAANGHGEATLTLKATDSSGNAIEATMTVVVVESDNNAPTVEEPIADIDAFEDSEDILINLDEYFSDPDLLGDFDELTFEVSDEGDASVASASIDGHWLRLTLVPNQHGESNVTIRATDLAGEFVETSFNLVVTPINDAPFVAMPANDIRLGGSSSQIVIGLEGVFADVDQETDDDQLTLSVVDESGEPVDYARIEEGQLIIDLDNAPSGDLTLEVVATDGFDESARLTISLNVLESLGATTSSGLPVEISLDDLLTLGQGELAELSLPAHGTLVVSDDDPSVLIYTSTAEFLGSDTAYFRVVRPDGTWSVGRINLEVQESFAAAEGIEVSDPGRRSATVTWEAAEGPVVEYQVQVWERAGDGWQLSEALSRTVSADESLEAELTGLQPDSEYRVVIVTLFDGLEEGLESEPLEFETLGLAAPTGFAESNIGVKEFTLTWNSSSDPGATAFLIQVEEVTSGTVVLKRRLSADQTELLVNNLRGNTQYRVTLTIEYDGQDRVDADPLTITTERLYQGPDGVLVTDTRYRSATVTWNAVDWNATGYSVDLEQLVNGTWKEVTSQHQWVWANAARQVQYTELDPNSQYRVTVTAKNGEPQRDRASSPFEFATQNYEAASGVLVGGVSFYQATLTWKPVNWNATGYSVDVEKWDGHAWQAAPNLHEWVRSDQPQRVVFTNLDADTHYRVNVTAKNSDLNGLTVERTVVSDSFDTLTLTVPTTPTISAVGSTKATVSWNKVDWPVDQYRIEYRAGSATAWTSAGTVAGQAAAQFEVNGLQPTTQYTFRIVALGSLHGDTRESQAAQPITTLGLAGPVVQTSNVKWQQGTVTWDAVEWNAKGYSVDLESQVNGTWKPMVSQHQWVWANEPRQVTFTGLDSNTQYRVTVTAKNADLNLEKGSTKDFQTREYLAPTNVQVINVLRMTATVTWTKVEFDAESYKIKVRANGGTWEEKGSVSGSASRFDLTGLKDNTSYEVKVIAINASPAQELPSLVQSFTTKAFTAPTWLTPTRTRTSVTLSWSAVDWDVANYIVKRQTATGWTDVTLPPGQTQYTFTGLQANKDYVFRVVAKNTNATMPSIDLTVRTLT